MSCFNMGVLSALGLTIAWFVSIYFFAVAGSLLMMGLFYNVKPIRTKDKVIWMFCRNPSTTPSIAARWFIVTSLFLPPVSLLIAYWMGGAFLMAVKRYAELQGVCRSSTAAHVSPFLQCIYREQFDGIKHSFTPMSFALFFGIFMIKYRSNCF